MTYKEQRKPPHLTWNLKKKTLEKEDISTNHESFGGFQQQNTLQKNITI